jgi:hypothetical protein
MQAADVGHAIERLVALVGAGPGLNPEVLREVSTILSRMGLGHDATGYKVEKLVAVKGGFETWLSLRKWEAFGNDPNSFRNHLLSDIEKLRKALARRTEGQD